MLSFIIPTLLSSGEVPPDPPPSTLLQAFRMRYPSFDGVADNRVSYWLTDADRYVTAAWTGDADPARMAYAAHQLVVSRAPGLSQDDTFEIPAGVTRFRSASMDVQISDAAANRSLSGGWDATVYGQDFAVMLRRNTGGPFLAGYVEPRCDWGIW